MPIPHTPESFLARIDKTAGPDKCWPWLGHHDASGYGKAKYEGRTVKAHRVAYALLIRPVADDLVIDHLCRNRICANPAHLEPVTQAENNRRRRAAQTLCVNGHPLAGENLTIDGVSGARRCRLCRRRQSAERKQRLRLIHPPRPNMRGENNPNVRLTAEVARAIRQSHETQAVLARRYAISTSMVGAIRTNQNWTHI